jgi:hypothetical protein
LRGSIGLIGLRISCLGSAANLLVLRRALIGRWCLIDRGQVSIRRVGGRNLCDSGILSLVAGTQPRKYDCYQKRRTSKFTDAAHVYDS